jgi:hypothetical protein
MGSRAGIKVASILLAGLATTELHAGLKFDTASGCVQGAGLQQPIRVYFGDTATTPILGDFDVAEQRFCPRFPFLPGRVHRAASGSEKVLFTPPSTGLESQLAVTRISPGLSEWPSNLLRFYVCFASPAVEEPTIRLLDLDRGGQLVADPFLELSAGLWDRTDRHRLTVFFHPGRIKRGLDLHDRLGPPLIEGHKYRLEIGTGFAHEFRAVASDRTSPDPKAWRVGEAPLAGSRDELKIFADGPLDEAIAKRAIHVEGLESVIEVDSDQRTIHVIPASPWGTGEQRIRIESFLEDLAGNRPGKLFDTPLQPGASHAQTGVLKFRPRHNPTSLP